MVLLGAIFGYPYFFLLAIGAVSHLGIGRLFWQVYQGRQTATRYFPNPELDNTVLAC